MLKIESKSVELNKSINHYLEFLENLNNYKILFPENKISNWKSNEDFCSLKFQNAYKLELIKDKIISNSIFLKSGNTSPVKFSLVIKFENILKNSCSVKIVCNADINPALKFMIGKPLNELFNYMVKKMEDAI